MKARVINSIWLALTLKAENILFSPINVKLGVVVFFFLLSLLCSSGHKKVKMEQTI